MPEQLEQTLTRIGRELDWPETPDLASSVTARLRVLPAADREALAAEAAPAGGPPAATGRRLRARLRGLLPPAGLRRALVLALVSLLVLAGGVFAAAPGVRDAVLEFLGLQGATIERRESLSPPPPQRPLDLGARTTLDAAAGRLAFDPLVPAASCRSPTARGSGCHAHARPTSGCSSPRSAATSRPSSSASSPARTRRSSGSRSAGSAAPGSRAPSTSSSTARPTAASSTTSSA